MKLEFENRIRNNFDGVRCVAPFVKMPNGEWFNIWDIPQTQYFESTEKAITWAFWRGVEAATMAANKALQDLGQ